MRDLRMNSKIIPWLFVWIWSTGFVAAKYGLAIAEPFTLLSYRNGLTLIVLIIFTQVKKSTWPKSSLAFIHLMVAGVLIHGIYLGGVFQAIKWEVSVGLTAMIIGLTATWNGIYGRYNSP